MENAEYSPLTRGNMVSYFARVALSALKQNDAQGRTASTSPSEDFDLSIERLSTDLVDLIETIFPTPSESPTLLVRICTSCYVQTSENNYLSS